MKAIPEDYAGEISSEGYKELIAELSKNILIWSLPCAMPLESKFSVNIYGISEQDAEQKALNEVTQMLEATRDSSKP